jgi:hypothetical protein
MMPEEEVLLSLSTKRYFPLDQLFDAAKELQLDSVTVAVDEDGLHSMSLDYDHYRYFEWHANRSAFDFQHYELRRPFNFAIDNIPDRPYLAALMRIWYRLSAPLVEQEIKIYKRENQQTFFAFRLTDFEFAFRVREESMRPQQMKELQFSARAFVYTDELSQTIKKLEKLEPDLIKLDLNEWQLNIVAVKDGNEVACEVLQPSTHYGRATSGYSADDFIRLCKIMNKHTSAVRLEFANNYPVKIEAAYGPGALTFVLAPNIPMQLRHEPHSP